MNALIGIIVVVAFVLLCGVISDWYYGRQMKQDDASGGIATA